MQDMQTLFDALGNPTRLKLYTILLQHELCVCELEDLLDISQPAISQHLNILEREGLIESETRSQWTFYKARSNPLREACDLVLEDTGDHWQELSEQAYEVMRKELCSLRGSPEPEVREPITNGR